MIERIKNSRLGKAVTLAAALSLTSLAGCSDPRPQLIVKGIVKEKQTPSRIPNYERFKVPMTVDVLNVLDEKDNIAIDYSPEEYSLALYVSQFVPIIAEGDTITFTTRDVVLYRDNLVSKKWNIRLGNFEGELISVSRHKR